MPLFGAYGCASENATPKPGVTATISLPGPTGDEGASAGARPPADNAGPARRNQRASPWSGMTVVIDPGHNGGNAEAAEEISRQVPSGPGEKSCDTVGAESADGYAEHRFTWEFSLLLRERLEERGIEVVMTRDDNEGVGPCINERAAIGNRAAADAAISIHADGAPADVRGFHIIAPGHLDGYTDDIVEPSRQLATDLRDRFHEHANQPYADYIGEEGIDVRTDLGGLNLSDVPKVFLEAGNLGNPEDAAKLTEPKWQSQAAGAVAKGLIDYLHRQRD
ncbi:N-acetylmuramoyl-L-alanine amidase [Salinactinospora qingdaonensis]|uniref:N-acetylmuramoyl-L-alanine amidase n=1 Tax=Salinactinospora qingdaonensis TaxID=702744 RepID=A0ABP7F2U2_9ACTN